MTGALTAMAGRLRLRPGAQAAVHCHRPLVDAAMLQRLTAGHPAAQLPDRVAGVFSLCAAAQRSTARRALRAALGSRADDPAGEEDARLIALHTAREHLQRLALDLPAQDEHCAAALRAELLDWLRGSPLMGRALRGGEWEATETAHLAWITRHLFGQPAQQWLRDGGSSADGLACWAARRPEVPLARWLSTIRERAQAITWPCRPLAVAGEDELQALARQLDETPGFATAPTWLGRPAETGVWTRAAGRCASAGDVSISVWQRIGARLAELARLACGARLAAGALPLEDGEAVAWTEMSRGLLIQFLRLMPGPRDPASARVERFQVLAPTEWNFHRAGGFARWLREARPMPDAARLACATLDPCIPFELEAAHA